MILPSYEIKDSLIPCAGKGLFVTQNVPKGKVIVAPDRIDKIFSEKEMQKFDYESIEWKSSVRWFENFFSITPEWTDECYINHSFTPNGLWHLGFIFAKRDIMAGEEITIDYRLILGDNLTVDFCDSISGQAIIGYCWKESLRYSTEELLKIID